LDLKQKSIRSNSEKDPLADTRKNNLLNYQETQMAIKIHKLFNSSYDRTNETRQASALCEAFEYGLPKNAEGNIYVLPHMACPAARNKDLDLVVWFDTPSLEFEVVTGIQGNSFPKKRLLRVVDALLILEIKQHNTYNTIRIQNHQLELSYNSDGFHNATEQSNGQKYALINFLKGKIGHAPFVVNLIWLHNADSKEHYEEHTVSNIFWGSMELKKLFEVTVKNNPPVEVGTTAYYRSSNNDDIKSRTTEYFEILAKNSAMGIGRISREKVNSFISKAIAKNEEQYFNDIGKKLTIIKGNPGTGKTIHLIHLANNLEKKSDFSCLILTFNKALQQDIKRLMKYSGLDNADKIGILTWDSFTFKCLKEYEEPTTMDFAEWTKKLNKLVEDLGEPKEFFKTANAYDCVLIDEGQDWNAIQKNIIFKLFGHKYTIVSIGKNQVIHTEYEQKWNENISKDERQQYTLSVSHRNKANIVDFLESFGDTLGYQEWGFIKNQKLIGGRVLITSDYSFNIHSKLVKDLLENENCFYDMMLLGGTTTQLDKIESLMANFGFKGFVASREGNREHEFPVDQFRIISYQACRGLEGWTVVCFEFDVFIEETLPSASITNLAETIKNMMFIILTRAIDSLVITLKDKKSDISKQIIEISKTLEGITEIKLN
jgi:hypothetical protein